MSDSANIQLDENKLNRMKLAILKAEQENLKTRERGDDAMVDLIRRTIIDEVKKTY